MKFSSLAWIVAAIHITTAAAAVRDVHCFKSHPAESNCGEADRAACSSRCEGTCQTANSISMATPEGSCDCWCHG
ncbi:hypothetical protein CGMCC3_g17464 [Colletotrichum fructicola]|nr:uncharacterized protein CGMCC3_g17464 [Colletotrichum fructicola]KAE9566377.1 hypothetical protein CGMCC3_g17464 [Colletotrichum fructicola]